MIHICMIGNSHLAALKRAWDKLEDNFPEIKITFFAKRGKGLKNLVVKDTKLAPNNRALSLALEFTSGGKRGIDPDEYDFFVICGLGAKANFTTENDFFSKAVIVSAMEDLAKNNLAFKLLKQLRKLTDKAIYIAHNPLVVAEKEIFSTDYPRNYINGINNINQLIYNPLKAELVVQPTATIVNGQHTHPVFSKGSKTLATGDHKDDKVHSENDIAHMNDQFGEVWLKEFFRKYVTTADSLSEHREKQVGGPKINIQSNTGPAVHAVIVDFFKAHEVSENLKTLTEQYPVDKLTVSVVDNSTSCKNADSLKSACDRKNIHLTINKTNRGYTEACNQGAKHSNADYILLLNPDIHWPQFQSLQMLVDVMESSPEVAICGPKQINPGGQIAGTIRTKVGALELIRRRIDWLNFLFRLVGGKSQHFFIPDYSKDQKVDWLQSSCLLIRNSFWKKVGGLDEKYFLFMADLDLCRKAWKLGFEVRYLASSVVHADGVRASAGSITSIFTNHVLRIHVRDAIKYFSSYRSKSWP